MMDPTLPDSDEISRRLMARLVWYSPELSLMAAPIRPVSIGSWHAMKLMGLRLFDSPAPAYPSQSAEQAEIAVFHWLHARSVPVAEIEAALWDGSWRSILSQFSASPPMEIMVAEFRALREAILSTIRAVRTKIIPRPRPDSAEIPPADLVSPCRQTWELVLTRRATGLPWEVCKWDFPYSQALAVIHALDWQEGNWTVPDPDGATLSTATDFSEFGLPFKDTAETEGDTHYE